MKFFGPALILAALGCSPAANAPGSETPAPTAPVAKAPLMKAPSLKADDPVVSATNQFGYKLFLKLPTKGNVMISPLSISLALRMAINGASGQTQKEMNEALGFAGMDIAQVNANSESVQSALAGDPEVKISIANSIWTRKGFPFEQPYLETVGKSYQAKISDIDFKDPGAAKTINAWVNESTNGKIDAIVPDPLPDSAVMYLINAVYFKAKWVSPFQSYATSPAPFTLADGSKVETPTMHKHEGGAFTLEGGRTGITLPYKDGAFEMVAILPSSSEKPIDLISAMAEKDLLANATPIGGPVELSLPKFKATFEDSINGPLAALGMNEAFTASADFTKMRTQRDVFVSDVRHKTFIDVTEEGTEAAAVTSIEMRGTAILAQPKFLKFDRPFVYLIRHRDSGQVLFLGVLQNPKA